ncbi:hypothetical protein EYF80_062070 [Liparis tanakae]|uniref:Uncharacterized protein n=1 Tax=Liparis tanakae TaxID=230148 RepID=A0A4Z2EH33_9TELE|nr:hypothetical protein EYF80_062070 [Liparis tanakae]
MAINSSSSFEKHCADSLAVGRGFPPTHQGSADNETTALFESSSYGPANQKEIERVPAQDELHHNLPSNRFYYSFM